MCGVSTKDASLRTSCLLKIGPCLVYRSCFAVLLYKSVVTACTHTHTHLSSLMMNTRIHLNPLTAAGQWFLQTKPRSLRSIVDRERVMVRKQISTWNTDQHNARKHHAGATQSIGYRFRTKHTQMMSLFTSPNYLDGNCTYSGGQLIVIDYSIKLNFITTLEKLKQYKKRLKNTSITNIFTTY